MRVILITIACFGLGGCVMPPVVSYASLVLDGVSYATTGKSVSDHALSAATDQDCAMWRVVSEQEIDAVCQDAVEATLDLAEDSDGDTGWGFLAGLFSGDGKAPSEGLIDDVTLSPTSGFGEIDPAKVPLTPLATPLATATMAAPNHKAIYLVLGSFKSVDQAESLASRVPGFNTAIAPALVGDDRYFRVVAGPFARDETGDAEHRLWAAGINNVWAASLCTNDLLAPPCESSTP